MATNIGLMDYVRKVYPNLEYEVFLRGYSNIGYFENIGFSLKKIGIKVPSFAFIRFV